MWPFTKKRPAPPAGEPVAPGGSAAPLLTPLAALQREMFALVVGEQPEPSASLVAAGSVSATERVHVYAAIYRARTHDALADDFALTRALLGEAFAPTVERYVRAHPSQHHSLARLGHAFASFLRAQPGVRSDLAELAALEWARAEAFVAPNAAVASAELAAQLGPRLPAARLTLSPSLRLLRLEHQVLPVWRALEAQQAPPEPVPGPQHVLVWRKRYEVFHVAVDADEAGALEQALAGADVQTVCEAFAGRDEPAAAAFAALGSWFTEEMVAAVH